jgi:hypothetical protein
MNICHGMLMTVPSPKTDIKASNERQFIIDDDKLLMMSLFVELALDRVEQVVVEVQTQ